MIAMYQSIIVIVRGITVDEFNMFAQLNPTSSLAVNEGILVESSKLIPVAEGDDINIVVSKESLN